MQEMHQPFMLFSYLESWYKYGWYQRSWHREALVISSEVTLWRIAQWHIIHNLDTGTAQVNIHQE